jgi:DNA helicase TIP49 (TBP-interacting protein)
MLTPARILNETMGRAKIHRDGVLEVDKLFFDGKASAKMLAKSEGYMK